MRERDLRRRMIPSAVRLFLPNRSAPKSLAFHPQKSHPARKLEIAENTACSSTQCRLHKVLLCYYWEKFCCFLAAVETVALFWKFWIMPFSSLAARELGARLPSICIHRSLWCVDFISFQFPCLCYLSPLPFGIFFLGYHVHFLRDLRFFLFRKTKQNTGNKNDERH